MAGSRDEESDTKPELPAVERFGDSIPAGLAEKVEERGLFPAGMVEKMMNEKVTDRYRLETPAFCSKCSKSYYRKDALQRHIKECGRVPPLSCTLCPYRTFRKVPSKTSVLYWLSSRIKEHSPVHLSSDKTAIISIMINHELCFLKEITLWTICRLRRAI